MTTIAAEARGGSVTDAEVEATVEAISEYDLPWERMQMTEDDWLRVARAALEAAAAVRPARVLPSKEEIARAICKSRTCEGINCCEWPANAGRRHNCPVSKGNYADAARAVLVLIGGGDERSNL